MFKGRLRSKKIVRANLGEKEFDSIDESSVDDLKSYIGAFGYSGSVSKFGSLPSVLCDLSRNIHCSQLIICRPVDDMFSKAACFFDFVSPSAILSSERTKPMVEISCAWYACLAACMSSMIRFR